jgi:SlyX protein
MSDTSDDRITELEIKLMHQERLVETLNEVIIEQRAQMDQLRRRLEGLERKLEDSDEEPTNEPPPHY